MKLKKLNDMQGGWFVGSFEPNILFSKDAEVAVKTYKKGAKEASHVHKIASEVTVILNGSARMGNVILEHGDIICLEPNEKTDFEALTDVDTIVVKTPSILGDKYIL
jgi:hypothetical protein